MKELFTELGPYVLPVLSGLLGWGGTVKYYRINGNGKWNGSDRREYVTKSEIKPQLEIITIRLDEIKADFKENSREHTKTFNTVFKEIGKNTKEISSLGKEVGRIQGAIER